MERDRPRRRREAPRRSCRGAWSGSPSSRKTRRPSLRLIWNADWNKLRFDAKIGFGLEDIGLEDIGLEDIGLDACR